MKKYLIGVIAVFYLASPFANANECNQYDAYAAEAITDYLDSWNNVHLFFNQFRDCYDGGAVAEGVGDAVQQLWAEKWHELPNMIAIANEDADFKKFIWQRIHDETFPEDTFKRVVHHATHECPSIASEFCRAVIAESKRPIERVAPTE